MAFAHLLATVEVMYELPRAREATGKDCTVVRVEKELCNKDSVAVLATRDLGISKNHSIRVKDRCLIREKIDKAILASQRHWRSLRPCGNTDPVPS